MGKPFQARVEKENRNRTSSAGSRWHLFMGLKYVVKNYSTNKFIGLKMCFINNVEKMSEFINFVD